MEKMNETLIRLKDVKDEAGLLTSFYTNSPSEYLKMYYFCYENNIPLSMSSLGMSNDQLGCIEDIDVCFGSKETLPCIDVWIEKW